MLEIDAGIVAIMITVLFALISFGVAWGILSEKVRSNRKDLDNAWNKIDKNREENAKEHKEIFTKLLQSCKNIFINHSASPFFL